MPCLTCDLFSHNSCPGVSISGQVSSRITSQQRARRHLTLPLTFNAKASPLQTDRRYNVYQHTVIHTNNPCIQSRHMLCLLIFHAVSQCLWFPTVTSGENSRCTMSPASAFAIATAAAGHSSSQGRHGKP